jgi:hypothetical protein
MTIDQLQRAHLFLFAYNEGAASGSLQVMKGICYILRNRVRKGWHDGNWIEVIEHADEVAGNMPGPRQPLDMYSRGFQQLLQAVDEIYYSSSGDELESVFDEALYYQFADRPLRPWFTENIIRYPQEHARERISVRWSFSIRRPRTWPQSRRKSRSPRL